MYSVSVAKKDRVPTEEEMESITKKVEHKWRLIGVYLGINQAELEQIEKMCDGDDSHCSSELFRKWSTQEISTSCPFTWKGVIQALDNSSVSESSLAEQLKMMHL